MRTLILLFISLTILNGADDVLKSTELKKSGDYVIDKQYNLMWQDTKDNINVLVSHIKAPEYCKNLHLGGHTDWRVPTVDEYKTIIDKKRKDELMIDRAFVFINQDDYWTYDRTWRNFGRWGYYIFFKSGAAYYENRTYPKYIRCVRDLK